MIAYETIYFSKSFEKSSGKLLILRFSEKIPIRRINGIYEPKFFFNQLLNMCFIAAVKGNKASDICKYGVGKPFLT